jgi:hypothetical protein
MTANEFRTQHGDPTTWSTADIEAYDVLRRNDAHLATQPTDPQDSANRLRQLLAPTA